MSFEPIPGYQLNRLKDEEIVAYVGDAHAAGDTEAEKLGLQILTYGWEAQVRTWVAAKVPEQDIGDVVVDVLESLTKACFKRTAVGKFGGLMRTITHHRIVDYHRDAERRGEHAQAGTGQERDDERVIIPTSVDENDALGVIEAVERVLQTRKPMHREVIRLYGAGMPGFEDLPAKEVVERIEADDRFESVSADNVAQIFKRFLAGLEEELFG